MSDLLDILEGNPESEGDLLDVLDAGGAPAPAPVAPADDIPTADKVRAVPRAAMRGLHGTMELASDWAELTPASVLLNAASAAATNRLLGRPMMPTAGQMTSGSAMQRIRDRAWGAFADRTRRKIPETDDPLLEGAISGAEALGAGLPLMGGGAALKALAGGAVGTGAGRALAEAQDMGEGATTALEVAGGVAGGMPGQVARLLTAPVRGAKNIIQNVRATLNPDRPPTDLVEEMVFNRLTALLADDASLMTDDAQALAMQRANQLRRRIGAGEVGPMSSMLDDPVLRETEQLIPALDSDKPSRLAMQGIMADSRRAAQDQGLGRIRSVGDAGDPVRGMSALKRVQQARQAKVAELEQRNLSNAAAVDEEAARALAAAEQPGATLPTGRVAAERAGSALEQARAASKARMDALYDAVPPDVMVAKPKGLRQSISRLLNAEQRRTGTDEVAVFREQYADVLDPLMSGEPMSVNQLKVYQRRLMERVSQAAKEGRQPSNAEERMLTLINQRIDGTLARTPGSGPLREATKAAREHYKTFGADPVKSAFRAGQGEKPGATADRLLERGVKGTTVRAALRADPSGEVGRALETRLNTQFENYIANKPNKAGAGRTWMQQREALLEQFPDVRQGLQDRIDDFAEAATLSKTAETQRKAATDLAKKQSGKLDRSPLGQFTAYGHENAKKAATSVLRSKTPARDARHIIAAAKRDGPGAVADVRSAFVESIVDGVTAASPSSGKRGVSASAASFMDDNADALRAVFSDDELKNISEGLDQLRRSLPGDTITPQGEIGRKADIAENINLLVARLGGARAAAAVTKNTLIAANLATKATQRMLKDVPDRQYLRLMTDALANPQRYLDLADKFQGVRTQAAARAALQDFVQRLATVGVQQQERITRD